MMKHLPQTTWIWAELMHQCESVGPYAVLCGSAFRSRSTGKSVVQLVRSTCVSPRASHQYTFGGRSKGRNKKKQLDHCSRSYIIAFCRLKSPKAHTPKKLPLGIPFTAENVYVLIYVFYATIWESEVEQRREKRVCVNNRQFLWQYVYGRLIIITSSNRWLITTHRSNHMVGMNECSYYFTISISINRGWLH